MIRTISVGSCVFVQGRFLTQTDDGKMMVEVEGKTYKGQAVNA